MSFYRWKAFFTNISKSIKLVFAVISNSIIYLLNFFEIWFPGCRNSRVPEWRSGQIPAERVEAVSSPLQRIQRFRRRTFREALSVKPRCRKGFSVFICHSNRNILNKKKWGSGDRKIFVKKYKIDQEIKKALGGLG